MRSWLAHGRDNVAESQYQDAGAAPAYREPQMSKIFRSRMVFRLIAALLFPIGLAGGLGCNGSPVGEYTFHPLPPPPNPTFGPPTTEMDGTGAQHVYWKVTSPASSGLSDIWVYLTNSDLNSGVSVRAASDGSYATRIEGQEGDSILFSFGAAYGETKWDMCRPLHEGEATTPCP
jgi:hypothetical protein